MLTREHTHAIVQLLQSAQLHIDYPKIRLQSNDSTIQLSVAGSKARIPNSINITDGKPFGSSIFYGRILEDNTIVYASKISSLKIKILARELELFAENPAQYAKLYSNVTGNCMFCSRELTDPQSVAVGYGPICAGHYGLPHGEIEQQVANDLAQIEMPIKTMFPAQKQKELMRDDFNAAINFALDKADGEGLLFLLLWREGDWESIQKEFPTFKLEN